MKLLIILICSVLLIGCQNPKKTNQNKPKAEEENETLKLSDKALEQFQLMFGEIPFEGVTYQFTSVEKYQPNFNPNMIKANDTLNLSYFILKADSFQLKIAINDKLCFASVIETHRGFDYPSLSIMHPNDFSWLNNENLSKTYNYENTDFTNYREVSYDKNLIGTWEIDSTISNETEVPIKNIEFSKTEIVINDSLKHNYEHAGYFLYSENPENYICKIFVSEQYAILVSNLYSEPEVLYCSKKK
jgi:hypothetical protein